MLQKIAALLFAAILVLLSSVTLCGERRRSSFHSLAPVSTPHFFKTSESWISVRSKHVLLIGNASERELRQIAQRLEQFREVVSQLFQNVSVDSPVPTTIIVFKDDASYGPFKRSDNNAGYFQPGQDVNYITLSGETRGEQDSGSIIFHEYTHLLINNSFGSVPAWFNEGLAELCSTLSISGDRRVFVGRPIKRHVTALHQNPLLPLQTLFQVDYKSPYYNETHKQGVFYAESWALIHYLMLNKNAQRAVQVIRFLDLLRSETSLETAFQKTFATTLEHMDAELRSYVVQDRYRFTESFIGNKLSAEYPMTSASISEAQLQAYLGDMLAHTNRMDAETYLQRALLLDPNLLLAHESFGTFRFRQGRVAEAFTHLEQAISVGSKNALVYYDYASVLCHPGEDAKIALGFVPEAATRARTQLKRAIQLRPDFADSYNLLAYINLLTGTEIDETIELLQAAFRRSPDRIDFMYMLGQLYMHKDDYKQARPFLERVVTANVEPAVHNHAQLLLKTMTDVEEQQAKNEAARLARGLRPSAPTQPAVAQAFTDPSTALREALRIPATGETQIQGILLAVECEPSGIVFVVKRAERTLRLQTDNFQKIRRTTFTSDVRGTLTCGARKLENPVVVCYVPINDKRTKSDGVLSSVEFVPADFRLMPEP